MNASAAARPKERPRYPDCCVGCVKSRSTWPRATVAMPRRLAKHWLPLGSLLPRAVGVTGRVKVRVASLMMRTTIPLAAAVGFQVVVVVAVVVEEVVVVVVAAAVVVAAVQTVRWHTMCLSRQTTVIVSCSEAFVVVVNLLGVVGGQGSTCLTLFVRFCLPMEKEIVLRASR